MRPLRYGLAQDRDFISAASAFKRAKRLEAQYGARLRQVARHIGDVVNAFDWAGSFTHVVTVQTLLKSYADRLHPWAEAVADRMVKQVAASDKQAWRTVSAQMGRALHKEIQTAPTGIVMRESLQRQVELITSLPTDAAERVQKLTQEAITTGRRAEDIAKEIMRTGEVTRSRASLIARTEVARTATELTKARAEHIGSTHFIWRTAGDADVRATHRKLNGKAFPWGSPPECDPGHHALPGAIWNCRCYPEAVIPD